MLLLFRYLHSDDLPVVRDRRVGFDAEMAHEIAALRIGAGIVNLGLQELARVLEAADPADEAWNWSDDHTVGFILRRQAHEALIHRLDAEQAAGDVTELDPRLAADGVEETALESAAMELGTD